MRLPALALAAALFVSACASTAPTRVDNARVYDASFNSALESVIDTVEEMRMEIESASADGTVPFVIVAAFATESARFGTIGSDSRRHTLTITVDELGGDGVVVRVQSGRQADITSARPNETQVRFLTILDRRMQTVIRQAAN